MSDNGASDDDSVVYLNFSYNVDGTLTRPPSLPTTQVPTDQSAGPVLIKDIYLNTTNTTWLRIFRPRHVHSSPSAPDKLPIIVYYHGGGFILLSAATTINHDFCANMATQLPALVVSVEYRLAPEHRLPAAYEDAVEAIHWIRNNSMDDEWLRDSGDASRCYLMGTSAGGNMAYHAALRMAAAAGVEEHLAPVKIRGFILHQPFFGGSQRTESEMRLVKDPILPLKTNDAMWELGLPIGVDRDHEFCNATRTENDWAEKMERIISLGWRFLVMGCEDDPLIDRQKEFARMLEGKGVGVVTWFSEGGYHGLELVEPNRQQPLFVPVKNFIHQSASL